MSNVFDNFNGDIRNWKGILIGTIVTIVNVVIIFLIDGFLLHPIPAPEGTFLSAADHTRNLISPRPAQAIPTTILSIHIFPMMNGSIWSARGMNYICWSFVYIVTREDLL